VALASVPRWTRRAALKATAVAGVGLTLTGRSGWGRSAPLVAAQEVERFPALGLRIRTPAAGAVPQVDLRRDFGAAGDGVQDDAPSFLALAAAVNAGQVPAGAVVHVPAGRYRVVGNETVELRRPVVLRGDGPGATVIQLEYSAQRSVFLRVQGQGNYVLHSTGRYTFTLAPNRYPNAPYSDVQGVPRRGDMVLTVAQPERFTPGDHVYLLCDDYGAEVVYTPTNARSEHFLIKQYLAVREVVGQQVSLDTPLRHDFAGAAPRLYRWQPVVGFGLEHLAIADQNAIADSNAATTFTAVQLTGVVHSWVWDVHFLDNTSHPLTVGPARRVVVCEALFDRARHVGEGGNGYLPHLYLADDSLVEYCTSVAGRHALICNWSCWGNVFRYNRLLGTPNTETHGEYSVENLYLRNDARDARMEIGGGGDRTHAHDGPYNELRENYARTLRVLKPHDRDARLVGNWYTEAVVDRGRATVQQSNQQVPQGWDGFPYAGYCGHDHAAT
jgi:hypothetical protein